MDARRDEQIRRVLDDCRQRRAIGEVVRRSEIIAAHPELMPELAEALRALEAESLAAARPELITTTRPAAASDFDDAAPIAPHMFPGYELIRELNRGGQGVVYQAIQAHTERLVAIKVLREGVYAARTTRRRFEREIRLAAQLQHPNIVPIFHSGVTDDGRQYYVMDFVDGVPLHRYIRASQATLEETVRIFAAACEAVSYAHERGIIHRDLKPSNILVDATGNPHVLDFGLAKVATGPADAAVSGTMDVLGTLPYMSPEQTAGNSVDLDARSDVYSLGVLLYELLTGAFPYPVAGSWVEVVLHIQETPPVPPSRRWSAGAGVTASARKRGGSRNCPLDGEIQTIALKALAKKSERRYASAGDFADDLRRYLAGDSILARRDSVPYLLWSRARREVQRHPWLTQIIGVTLIVFATQDLIEPIVYRWTQLNAWYELALTAGLNVPTVTSFDYVRVVALTDQTDISALADAASLAGVSADNLVSLRRLHGALFQRIADSGLKGLVSDIRFASPSEFDEDLARGVRAIKEHGADAVIAVSSWTPDEAGLPNLTPALLPYVRWGAATGDLSGERPWSLDLLMERPGYEPSPSLTLLAVAAHQAPGAEVALLVDGAKQGVSLSYFASAPGAPQAKRLVRDVRHVQLTGRWLLPEDNAQFGLKRGDLIGHYLINVPPDEVLRRATLEYYDVFLAEQRQLRDWFSGRVVLVGDFRNGIDRHPNADGRELSGCHAQAVAIEGILQRTALRTPRGPETWLIVIGSALLGWLAGTLTNRAWVRASVLLLLALWVAIASVAAYGRIQLLFNPLLPMFALVSAGLLVAALRGQRFARGSPSASGR